MRLDFSSSRRHVAHGGLPAVLSVALTLGVVIGCHADKAGGSNSSTNGSGNQATGSGGGPQKSGSQGGGGSAGGGNQLTEPSESTNGSGTGQVAADSDDGSPGAVAHSSTAMPGAPQSTLKGKQQDRKLDSPESQAGSPKPQP